LDHYWFELQAIGQPLFWLLKDELRSAQVVRGGQSGRTGWRWPSEDKHVSVFETIAYIVLIVADAHFAMGVSTQCGEDLVEIKLDPGSWPCCR
jgi:hypothetical protein